MAKHAEAKQVAITLVRTGGAVTMSVADNGSGFDPESAAGAGLGLHSMRERIEALGGALSVESTPGTGTRLVARLELE